MQAWGALDNLESLLVDHNSLTGYLPPSFGNFRQLRILSLGTPLLPALLVLVTVVFASLQVLMLHDVVLTSLSTTIVSAGNTALVGGLPTSWSNMTSLQALDVSDNCGICGSLPAFPPSVLGKLQVESQGSGLGWSCNRNTCAAFPISILAQAGAVAACPYWSCCPIPFLPEPCVI